MVEIEIQYEGGLRCRAVHGPSRVELRSDAPLDNQGRGESFSPTDLVATALGTCMATCMGMVARRNGWAIEGTRVHVKKGMVADPKRRIGRLDVRIEVPGEHDPAARATLEETARTCPVALSIHPGIEAQIEFVWSRARART